MVEVIDFYSRKYEFLVLPRSPDAPVLHWLRATELSAIRRFKLQVETHVSGDISSWTIEDPGYVTSTRIRDENEWISGERPRLLEIATRYKLNAKFHRRFVVAVARNFTSQLRFFLVVYLITHVCAPEKKAERKMAWIRSHVVVYRTNLQKLNLSR